MDIFNNIATVKPEIRKRVSTPEIEKVREAYRALRKNLKGKGVPVAGIKIGKRKGIYGIKIDLTSKDHAALVPVMFNDVPVQKINIVEPPPVPPPQVVGSTPIENSKFKIETVKWSWANAVQSKGVYRDDEFVRTQTRDEALEAIGFLMSRARGLTYTITVFRDGEYFTYFRHSMPCFGGLVKYRDSHGAKYFMNPYFPRDIRVASPEGDIIFIACQRAGGKDIFKVPYNEFIFSQESPWVTAFGTKETVIFNQNHFILTNMDTDPTVFYSLMRLGGMMYYGAYGAYGASQGKVDPRVEILLTKTAQADPRRLAGQKPVRISGGTWAEGYGYTRPYNESIFKTSLPHKLKEFGKLAGYPQAPYTNKYYIEQMTKKFGIKNAATLTPALVQKDKGLQEAMLQAWQFFKEESKKMSDEQ